MSKDDWQIWLAIVLMMAVILGGIAFLNIWAES